MPVNEFDANDPYDWADEYLDFLIHERFIIASNRPTYVEWRDSEKGA